ncbi:MAG TPA: ABC transporter permease [Candidatus Hydrogenedentes bacterium]|jgi:ribose/xylose/arabinose/galactoside ABC-type transport system permease subunit|nr:ABC transporter permease [Candidatus Hydrogenedentota bacterium]HOH35652.1 ABC transporter permease [Candidatus Hydrogenedentota bacterium]HPA05847.1 ABC transporter permease [Candidatus Hydrogenedentota bacterium]HPV37996.1 ABC transporter permease [Candidatus Hydrogenedentota bacterium]HQM34205.1 ABC transporter permease [Candidatus Hydrogenedentota bacterium]
MRRFLAKHSPLVILAVLCLIIAALMPNFRKPGNIKKVAYRTPVFGIMASGETLVILTGGIDLSVGSLAALSGVVNAKTINAMEARGLPGAVTAGIAAGLAVAALCGAISGFATAYGKIPSFISTLGMMMIARGAALVITGGVPVRGFPDRFAYLGGTRGWYIPVSFMAVIVALLTVLLVATRFGRAVYAIGGNSQSARLSGIPVNRDRMIVFILCALLAGFAGIVETSRVDIAAPTGAEGYELEAVAACVIGGASLMGGEGTVIGALAGTLIMQILVNLCNLLHIETDWQKILVGTLVIVLVAYDTHRKRKSGLLKE